MTTTTMMKSPMVSMSNNNFEEELDRKFNKYRRDVKRLRKRPTDEELLEIYGLFKQAMIGNVNIQKPGMFNFSKQDRKWNAWKSREGLHKNTAKKMYVDCVRKLKKKYGMRVSSVSSVSSGASS